jgi:hypothetical protein
MTSSTDPRDGSRSSTCWSIYSTLTNLSPTNITSLHVRGATAMVAVSSNERQPRVVGTPQDQFRVADRRLHVQPIRARGIVRSTRPGCPGHYPNKEVSLTDTRGQPGPQVRSPDSPDGTDSQADSAGWQIGLAVTMRPVRREEYGNRTGFPRGSVARLAHCG